MVSLWWFGGCWDEVGSFFGTFGLSRSEHARRRSPVQEYADVADGGFDRSRVVFEQVVAGLGGVELGGIAHGELEDQLTVSCRELVRMLLQDHLDLRAAREQKVSGGVTGPDGQRRPRAETGCTRALVSVFGVVQVTRIAYRSPGLANVYPADKVLNLPAGSSFSHGIRRLAVLEAIRGSFAGASEAIERATGVRVGTRQIRGLILRAGADVDPFYETRLRPQPPTGDVLVLTLDGKGVVMRPESLRKATAAAAAKSTPRLGTRLSPGEKTGRKRMAELACVYDIAAEPRTATDVLPSRPAAKTPTTAPPPVRRPRATGKWLSASLINDIPTMVAAAFAEADRRDPDHERTWVALVDGNHTQIAAINAEAAARSITVPIIIDFIHVLEYVWSAAWSFFDKGDPDAEDWVTTTTRKILQGNAVQVAAGIRRRATRFGFTGTERKNADITATYLINHATHLDYPTALTEGWPIATGVIEGACRHLVKDRMDLTGARWGLAVAEAILTLRAVHTTGDLPDYWTHHLTQEHHRTYPQHTQNAA
jgi:hypothetical protein